MKVKLFTVFLCLSSFWLSAQKTIDNSFKIIENKSQYTNEFISASILKANFEPYRLRSKNAIINCENGIAFELFSAKELFIKGINIGVDSYEEESVPLNEFTLTEAGTFSYPVTHNVKSNNKSGKK